MEKKMRQALIVWGGWSGHEPEAGAAVVADMLRKEDFSVRVENDINAFGDPAVHTMNLVIPVISRATIERPVLMNLIEAVKSGVGLAGYHGGMAASFRDAVSFHFMCGSQWVAHPGD